MSKGDAPEAEGTEPPPPVPQLSSWTFWRKRLAHALIVGALALAAAQILPALPEDQLVQIQAPPGVKLRQVEITYFSPGGEDPLAGSQITLAEPTGRVPHKVRLADGEYVLSLRAQGTDSAGGPRLFQLSQPVKLGDGATRVFLEEK